jgi:hypothetical protein
MSSKTFEIVCDDSLEFRERKRAISAWCKKNLGSWGYDVDFGRAALGTGEFVYKITIPDSDPNGQLLFKLTWGGKG